ncbi:MAG: cell division ATPase MinD [Candidatus Diapherotrites archaeon]|nr:cell division ATPase MinD [Candidatus Diapherotrites archaeon]
MNKTAKNHVLELVEMGRVICIASGKGGVGKTFLTGNVGIALAQHGFSVCLVDADIAMANLSLLLGMQSSPITLHDVLLGEATIQDAIYEGPKGVKFIPSGLSLENYRRVDSERLESVINSIANQFDFVLLDIPAGIEKNVLSAIAASDEVLLIATPDPPSIADVLKTKIVAQRLNRKTIGIVLNLVRGEKGEISDTDVMKMLELPVYGIIPYDPEVRKTFLHEKGGPLMVRTPDSPAALAVQKTASKIAGIEISIASPKSKNPIMQFFNKLFSIFKKKPKASKD